MSDVPQNGSKSRKRVQKGGLPLLSNCVRVLGRRQAVAVAAAAGKPSHPAPHLHGWRRLAALHHLLGAGSELWLLLGD